MFTAFLVFILVVLAVAYGKQQVQLSEEQDRSTSYMEALIKLREEFRGSKLTLTKIYLHVSENYGMDSNLYALFNEKPTVSAEEEYAQVITSPESKTKMDEGFVDDLCTFIEKWFAPVSTGEDEDGDDQEYN